MENRLAGIISQNEFNHDVTSLVVGGDMADRCGPAAMQREVQQNVFGDQILAGTEQCCTAGSVPNKTING